MQRAAGTTMGAWPIKSYFKPFAYNRVEYIDVQKSCQITFSAELYLSSVAINSIIQYELLARKIQPRMAKKTLAVAVVWVEIWEMSAISSSSLLRI